MLTNPQLLPVPLVWRLHLCGKTTEHKHSSKVGRTLSFPPIFCHLGNQCILIVSYTFFLTVFYRDHFCSFPILQVRLSLPSTMCWSGESKGCGHLRLGSDSVNPLNGWRERRPMISHPGASASHATGPMKPPSRGDDRSYVSVWPGNGAVVGSKTPV